MSEFEIKITAGEGIVGNVKSNDNFLVCDFDPCAEIGKKGIKRLDRAALLTLVAASRLKRRGALEEITADNCGVILGSSTGSISSSTAYTLDTLTQERPDLVSAALFPTTVMNHAASQLAIRYGYKAINSTLSGGRLSFASALKQAMTSLYTGSANQMIVGCVEEGMEATQIGFRVSNFLQQGIWGAEGVALFVVKPKNTNSNGAIIHSVEVSAAGARRGKRGLVDSIKQSAQHALKVSGFSSKDIDGIIIGSTNVRGIGDAEKTVAKSIFPSAPLFEPNAKAESFTASGALQIFDMLGRSGTWVHIISGTDGTAATTIFSGCEDMGSRSF